MCGNCVSFFDRVSAQGQTTLFTADPENVTMFVQVPLLIMLSILESPGLQKVKSIINRKDFIVWNYLNVCLRFKKSHHTKKEDASESSYPIG